MDFSLIIDALIAVLLVATIAYAAVLNRKLGILRDGKTEMAALIASFSDSAERAGSGVETLKQAAGRSGEDLQRKVDVARGLVDDLGFLIEKGARLAERLDGGVGAARAKPAANLAANRAPAPRKEAERPAAVAASPEFEAAPANNAPANNAPANNAPDDSAGEAGSGEEAATEAATEARAAELSAAESELLKALQGMR
jgi:hypothetical protein